MIVCGPTAQPKHVFDDHGDITDPSIVGGQFFNKRYRGMSYVQALGEWEDRAGPKPLAPPAPPVPSPPQSVAHMDLRRWQRVIDGWLRAPPGPLGRTILWLWEEAGGFGKSVLSAFFRARRGALLLQVRRPRAERSRAPTPPAATPPAATGAVCR